MRLRRLFTIEAVPGWIVTLWKVVEQAANIDFLVSVWDRIGDDVSNAVTDWGWVFGILWLTYVALGGPIPQVLRRVAQRTGTVALEGPTAADAPEVAIRAFGVSRVGRGQVAHAAVAAVRSVSGVALNVSARASVFDVDREKRLVDRDVQALWRHNFQRYAASTTWPEVNVGPGPMPAQDEWFVDLAIHELGTHRIRGWDDGDREDHQIEAEAFMVRLVIRGGNLGSTTAWFEVKFRDEDDGFNVTIVD